MHLSASVRLIAAAVIASVLGLGMWVPMAFANTKDNFNNCLDLGGSVQACCAGVGGTYTKHPGGVETCVYVIKATEATSPPPSLGTKNLNFARPPIGVVTSLQSSDGKSQAGLHGLQLFEYEEPPIILE